MQTKQTIWTRKSYDDSDNLFVSPYFASVIKMTGYHSEVIAVLNTEISRSNGDFYEPVLVKRVPSRRNPCHPC